MQMANQIQQWLEKYQTNGVVVDLPELIAYRNFANRLNLSPSRDIAGALSGSERSKIKGRGMEFDEARHYQPGDDIRSIDWRVTARTGKTHTKVYREERERPVFVMLDFMRSMHFGTEYLCKSVQASHLASFIIWNAVKRGDKIGGLFFSELTDKEYKPKAQAKSALALLQGLLEAQNTAHDQIFKSKPTELNQINVKDVYLKNIQRLRYLAKPGSLVYLIGDFNALSEAALNVIGAISRHCEIKTIVVSDPLELSLPHTGVKQSLSITDGVARQQLQLGESKTFEDYKLQQQAHFAQIKEHFSRYKILTRSITASLPIEEQINQYDLGVLL